MRRPNRNIEIFSMSVLDMFASALGAFILITIILFPDYNKKMQLEEKLERAREQVAQDQSSMKKMQEELLKTFLLVTIEWVEAGDSNDVDLHVTDPHGNEFYFIKNNRIRADYPSSEAELSRDSTFGPGIEVWLVPVADPGNYRIEYLLYSKNQSTPTITVQGNVYSRKGRIKLPPKSLSTPDRNAKIPVSMIVVGQDGSVNAK